MRTKIFAIILISLIGILPLGAQEIVQGFLYDEDIVCPVGSRTNYYEKRNGEGGNLLTWTLRNMSDYSGQLYPIVSVDKKQQSYDRVALPTGGSSIDGQYEVADDPTKKEPYVWDMDFRIEWVQYAESVVRKLHINAYANAWIPVKDQKKKEEQKAPVKEKQTK